MTPSTTTSRLHHRPSRLRDSRIDALWWCAVMMSCALVWSARDGGHAFVRAQFAANPLILNAANALLLNGIAASDQSGYGVSGVGDVNGDDVDDFVVSTRFADPLGVLNAGQVFLLFGCNASTPWPNPFELSSLGGTNGVTIKGIVADDLVGIIVSGVKDVNGDGINDMLIGSGLGEVAYVLFGVNGTWPGAVNVAQGAFNGFTIVGRLGERTGRSVGDAGDVNNDGIHDIAVGSPLASTSGGSAAGRMDVLYGRPSGSPWPAVVDVTTYVNASTGFTVLGENVMDNCGTAVSGVGDVNGDGVDDVAVACPFVDAHGVTEAGIVAVVFGSSLPMVEIVPSQLNGTNGFVVNGQRTGDRIGSALCLLAM